MKQRVLPAILALAGCAASAPAAAYIGPGAGLSLLGALWGLVVAIAVTLGFVVLWPLRRMMRKKQAAIQSADRRPEGGNRPPG